MGDIHRLLKEQGKEAALKSDFARDVIEAAAGYLASEDTEIGFLYSGWAQSALPHRRLPDGQAWQIQTERVTLIVSPGHRPGPDDQPVAVGVPYGSRARLILLYLQSEALRTSSREIELGKTLHAWLRRLEIPIGGKAMQVVRDQAERISRCRMSFQIKQGSRTGLVNQNLLDTSMFVEDDATQGTLFLETAILSQQFYDQLRQHPVPVEEAAVRQIANNSLALDIYCWLAYRLHSLREATPVSWRALHGQFGRGVARQDHFRDHFRQVLQLAVSVYPEAQVEEAPGGLVLKPSRPPVAPRVVSSVTGRTQSRLQLTAISR